MSLERKPHGVVPVILVLFLLLSVGCQLAGRQNNANTVLDLQTIIHNDLERTYRLHLPDNYDDGQPLPLVLALHGGGGTSRNMSKLTGGLNLLADQEGFIVVYPDGVDKHWSDGRTSSVVSDADDVGFLSALIEHLAGEYNIDPARIYATGISNGGMMSFRLACDLSDRITAVASVASAMPEALSATCNPSLPVSVLIIGGSADPLVPWQGGEIVIGRQKRGRVLSAADVVQFWVEHNGCDTPPRITQEPDREPKDGTRVRREAYEVCDGGIQVILYAIEGGGHT